jgi:hypothetical protein
MKWVKCVKGSEVKWSEVKIAGLLNSMSNVSFYCCICLHCLCVRFSGVLYCCFMYCALNVCYLSVISSCYATASRLKPNCSHICIYIFSLTRSLSTTLHTHCTPGCVSSVSPTVLQPRRPVWVLHTNNLAKTKRWCRGNASPGRTQTGGASLGEHFHSVQTHRRRSDRVELASSGECQTPLSGPLRLELNINGCMSTRCCAGVQAGHRYQNFKFNLRILTPLKYVLTFTCVPNNTVYRWVGIFNM